MPQARDTKYPLYIFISYAHEDEPDCDKLKRQLASLKEENEIKIWNDRKILPGADWNCEINEKLERADIILLLVSDHFIASEYIKGIEIEKAVERGRSGVACVVPIILKPVDYAQMPVGRSGKARLGQFHALPRDAKAIASWPDPDEAWVDVAKQIRRLCGEIRNVREGLKAEAGRTPVGSTRGAHTFGYPQQMSLSPIDEAVWRYAYAFLLLDQLPSGGWGRSLPDWFNAIFRHQATSLIQAQDVRKKGGVALTGMAFWSLTEFLYDQFRVPPPLLQPISQRVREFFKRRIGVGGGIDRQSQHESGVMIHHTLTALISFIECYRASKTVMAYDEANKNADYIITWLNDWRTEPRYFGIYAACVQLRDMIELGFGNNLISPQSQNALISQLDIAIPEIGRELATQSNGSFFHHDHRLKRSDFLLHLPWILTINVDVDGKKYGLSKFNCDLLFPKIQQSLGILVQEVCRQEHRDVPAGEKLLRYYDTADGYRSLTGPGDWGLTAELAALLRKPGIQNLVENSGIQNLVENSGLCERLALMLQSALRDTFQSCDRFAGSFSMTHGVSFSKYLSVLPPGSINQDQLQKLDRDVINTLRDGVTEKSLWELSKIIQNDCGITYSDCEITCNDANVIGKKDLFMSKLEAGEYVPNDTFCPADRWNRLVDQAILSTKAFFDSDLGRQNVEHNSTKLINTFTSRISDFWSAEKADRNHWYIDSSSVQPRALDIGCGDGAYAIKLAHMGFHVDLLDISLQLLNLARKNFQEHGLLKDSTRFFHQNFLDKIDINYRYDVIFVSAVLFHIPRSKLNRVITYFFNLLNSGGLLFVNIKIKDHSLISLDGRFFEYFADHIELRSILEETGFQIEEIVFREKKTNMYEMVMPTSWANFYCLRP